MKRGDWTDSDEILLLLEMYFDVRDQGRDLGSAVKGLAKQLGRDADAVKRAVMAFAKDDPKAPPKSYKDGLSAAARALWDRYQNDAAEVRRLAREIRARGTRP
jgi:hypothetical protein